MKGRNQWRRQQRWGAQIRGTSNAISAAKGFLLTSATDAESYFPSRREVQPPDGSEITVILFGVYFLSLIR
jgi:hypothetical protein